MQRKNHSIKNSNISEKGIGSFLSKILQDEKSGNYTPAPEDITQGEPVYNSVVDQVNAARDSALDMKKRFESINIADDPESAEKLKRELQQLQFESNRYRRIAQAPDQKPSFWRYIFHPFTRGQSRDQITTIDLDKRRLYASSIRDDMNLINSQAMILADIAQDVNLDTNFELKSFKVKASLQDSVNDIARYLDIMIDTLSKTSRDLTQAGKSVNTMNKIKSTRDNEEIATVNAALKYYKAMKETTKDIVTTKQKTKFLGLGGSSDDNPNGIEIDELSELVDDNRQAENDFTLEAATQIKPEAYGEMGNELNRVANLAENLLETLPDNQSQLTQQPVNASQQLDQAMNDLNRLNEQFSNSNAIDPYNYGQSQEIVNYAQEFIQDFGDLGDFVSTPVGGDAFGSYRSVPRSTKKIDLKKKKAQLAALVVKLKKAAQKFKKKKQSAEIVKKQAVQAKAILSQKNK